MLIQDSPKVTNLPEITEELRLIQECLDKFPNLQAKTQQAQFCLIQNKYKYFLRKYHKTIDEHAKYKQLYQNLDKTVEQSNLIKQQNQSIDFIKKIMESTEQKYNVLFEETNKLREQRQKLNQETVKLKSILMKMKRDYTQLQMKKEETHKNCLRDGEIKQKEQITKNMFKIRIAKRSKTKENLSSHINLDNVFVESSFYYSELDHKLYEEFQYINSLKEQFLSFLGLTLNEFYKKSQKSYDNQSFLNELVKKREFKFKNKFTLKSIENYDPATSKVQVFRITKCQAEERQKFMNLSFEQMMKSIISKNKVGQVLHLIEQEKKEIIKAMKENKQNKSKIY